MSVAVPLRHGPAPVWECPSPICEASPNTVTSRTSDLVLLGDTQPYEERYGLEQRERDPAVVHPRRLPRAAAGMRSGQETM